MIDCEIGDDVKWISPVSNKYKYGVITGFNGNFAIINTSGGEELAVCVADLELDIVIISRKDLELLKKILGL